MTGVGGVAYRCAVMQRTLLRLALAALIVMPTLVVAPVASAKRLDGYCGEDTCAGIYRRKDWSVFFRAVGFMNYFGTITVCVEKETEVCLDMPAKQSKLDGMWYWRLAWQGNFPDEGPGRYAVTMTYGLDELVGNDTWAFWLPRHLPSPTPTPTPSPTPSPSA